MTVSYRLDAATEQEVSLETGAGSKVTANLPVARVAQVPVADRVPRKEVYPYAWAEQSLGELRIPADCARLTIRAGTQVGEETGLWIKSVRLRRLP